MGTGRFATVYWLIIALSLTMAACAHTSDPQTVCLAIKDYTPAEQDALADALEKLPADSIVVKAILDYGALRDEVRACMR